MLGKFSSLVTKDEFMSGMVEVKNNIEALPAKITVFEDFKIVIFIGDT